MSRQDQTVTVPRRGRVVKFLAALVSLSVVCLSLYASQKAPLAVKESPQPAQAKAAEQMGDDKALVQTTKAVAAAKAFLDTLDAKQKAKAVYDFNSAKKSGWSNLPITNVPRNGVRMGDLTQAQRDAAFGVLKASLSKQGYQKIIDIMNADQQLATGKGGKGGGKNSFGNDNYFLALFGEPSVTKPWMVQFGGHHLGLNVTVASKTFVLTPTHTGTQPQTFTRDGKAVRPLGGENDTAFKLVNSLDEKQKAQAMLKEKVKEMILGPGKDGKTIKPQGVKGSELNANQQTMLLDVIAEWTKILPDDDAAARMAELKGKLPETYFAWSGPTTNGSAVYFRVQGPSVVIEYAAQGTADHIHTVIRDPGNDYGQKLLKN
ncbi:MAG TPA: DUF3500 domain-containing protein [Gemmataceae bacterium]|nr:DUF3500 domain-containing protein [Gemmataceae bacterium]